MATNDTPTQAPDTRDLRGALDELLDAAQQMRWRLGYEGTGRHAGPASLQRYKERLQAALTDVAQPLADLNPSAFPPASTAS